MGNTYEPLLYAGAISLFLEKALVQLFELWAELADFSMENLIERTTETYYSYSNECLAVIFSKMNKASLSLNGKLLAMKKICQ